MINNFKSKLLMLASPNVMFFSLIWLMVIVIVGTVAQKYVGLYQAQHAFFSSPFFWWGPIPFPGGLFVMSIIFWCLLVKLIFASKWNIQNAGVIVTHIGGLLILVGGLLTVLSSSEGSMQIYEGETSNFITDYHARELAVYDEATNTKIMAVPLETLSAGTKVVVKETPLVIDIITACRNCEPIERNISPGSPSLDEYKGRSKNFSLKAAALSKEDEQNRAGIEFRVSGAAKDDNGIYFSVDFIEEAPSVKVGDKSYRIALQRRHTYLPFNIKLIKFDKQLHPGTEIARSYRSDIILKDGGTEWKSVIQMNEPLRYKGYTFYQSSFIDEGEKKATILAVVKNAGRWFPYLSGAVIGIGLILHMIMRLPKLIRGIMEGRETKKKSTLVALVLFSLLALGTPAHASPSDFDYDAFKKIPVMDQGRVKPMSTLAEVYLKYFYGHPSMPHMSAIEWLAEILFTPEDAYDRKVFNISDPRVVDALGLERRGTAHYYTYHEVGLGLTNNTKAWHPLFDKPEDQLTAFEKELMATYQKAETFGILSRSLSLFFPDFSIPEGPIAAAIGVKPGSNLSYVEMLDFQETLDRLGKDAMAQSQKHPGAPALLDSSSAKALLELQKQIDTIGQDRMTDLLKVIPPQWDSNKVGKLWYSPWGITVQGQGSPELVPFLSLWRDLVAEYRQNKPASFAYTAESIDNSSLQLAGDAVSGFRTSLEVAYNDYQPFKISMGLYAVAFILVLISLMIWTNKLYYASAGFLFFGFVFHGIGLFSRMIIMGRPPVTNLYASIIFVGFMVALTAMAYEWRMRNRIGVIVASIAGLVLQFLGLSYDVEGDTMGMLVAVLDTNFWLSTHVTCMTTGYASCILGSLMAHVYLVMRMVKPTEVARLDELSKNIRGVSYLALMFTTVGTILGGIWADQSWGRFWGWDPKENGALLICLWLLFCTHGRMAGRFKDLGFNIGMALTSVSVSLAWFGVNLLAIGLHSYGFTQGAATGLVSFISAELLFAATSYMVITKWQRKSSS